MTKLTFLFALLFTSTTWAVDVYVYELIDEGGFLDNCEVTTTSPLHTTCTPDGKWHNIDIASGYITYDWIADGTIKVNGDVCDEKDSCKHINDAFSVVKTLDNQLAVVINSKGELVEVIATYNAETEKFTFGGEAVGYLVKAIGDVPDY